MKIDPNQKKLTVTVKNNAITFGDPNSNDKCSISFQRTLRIPEDGKVYPLPPSLGQFPIEKVDDYLNKVPEEWKEHGGVFIPMYQREAMWMQFTATNNAPKAVKVAVGKVNALTGKQYNQRLTNGDQDYVVIPNQPWLDGINNGNGTVKQFVAMPLGQGYTVEEQVTGKSEFGGIQLCVFDSYTKPQQYLYDYEEEEYDSTNSYNYYPSAPKYESFSMSSDTKSSKQKLRKKSEEKEMGISSGGKMKQKIYPDPYGYTFWNEQSFGRVFVHIVNSAMYEKITGKKPPKCPIDVNTYKLYNYPWYDVYDEDYSTIKKSNILNQVKTVSEIDSKKYDWPKQDDSTINIKGSNVITLKPKVKDSVRDGNW